MRSIISFGPSSLENEDVVISLDRTLADLLRFVDDAVGLDETLIVLSADHGMADMPEYAAELGFETGRIYGDEILTIAKDASRKTCLGTMPSCKDFFRPYLYLDHDVIDEMNLNVDNVARSLAR